MPDDVPPGGGLVARGVVLNSRARIAWPPLAGGSAGGSKARLPGSSGVRATTPSTSCARVSGPTRNNVPAGPRRLPPAAGTRRWTMMPRKLAAIRARVRGVSSSGVAVNRSRTCGMSPARRPASTSRPVSTASTASRAAAGSARSPTTRTSRSCRLTERRAAAADGTSVPTSRWTTTPLRSLSRYSTGSSIVTTRQGRRAVRSSTSAASVVVFPCPGPPATMHQPRARLGQLAHLGGQPERVERGDLGRDQAKRQAEAAAVVKKVSALPPAVAGGQRDDHVAGPLQRLAAPVVQQGEPQAVQELARQRGDVAERAQLARDPENRRQPRLQVNVGGAEAARRQQRSVEEGVHVRGPRDSQTSARLPARAPGSLDA